MDNEDNDRITKYKNFWILRSFIYNFFGTTLPFVIMLALLPIASKFCEIYKFIEKGDFFLYSAALWSTCLFLFQENKKAINNNFDNIIGSISWLFIAISAGAYIFLYLTKDKINFCYILILSLTLLILSGVSLYRFLIINSLDKVPEINIQTDSHKQIELLKEKI